MPVDEESIRALVERVAAFYVTDKTMLTAQRAIEAALVTNSVDERAARAYLNAVKRYFGGFENQARAQLRDVDKRLEHANQVVFNLTAERGVVVKRIEATRAVLDAVLVAETGTHA
jgi:intergrase/recombinase